ncbi:NUDIX hydrolase [Caenimonas koreensis]|uniref:NUDIX hydrolase n=1 Tax=Caenimonas koreensis DSM 17982 TaxID=1121255 RepID=A0A844AYS7_9BURK|nr:NUDIX hydrolase [Caenimonas koreensis]MRD49710.1 NUDIX hydrolase [Caenimonas koreensis DSM 17982]
MQVNLEHSDAPVRDAATVVMLRDAPDGLEVFLMKRHGLSDVLGGAYVFAGGKVDLADATIDIGAHLDHPAHTLHALLGEPGLQPEAAAALYIAALREAFEETGVLYAHGATAADAALASGLLREGRAFDEVLAMMNLRLSTSSLQPWSRWITPSVGGVMRKRFDTRFFLASVPAGQQPHHDNHEATESAWLTPKAALQQYWERTIELAPPQVMSLAHLSRHASVASAVAQARTHTPPVIHPEPWEHAGDRVICYPGDEHHSVRERAMPGPTRLHYRNKRFEPEGGFEALFD